MRESVFAERRRRAALALSDHKRDTRLDCLLIAGPENIRYLSGFTGSNALLLLFADSRAFLYTDPRYTIQASHEVDCPVRIARTPLMNRMMRDFAKSKRASMGIDREHLTVGMFQDLMKLLPNYAMAYPVGGIVETFRVVKDPGEIELIRKSVHLNSAAFDAALKKIKPGISETDVAAEIDYRSRRLGAERPAFATIVASGERAALPHAHPGAAKLGPGMLLIDMGAFREGYASDMTRMVHLGKAPAEYRHAYQAVREAQAWAIDAVKPGVGTKAVDAAAREMLKQHGYDKEFVHSTGHGLGLEIHEAPRIGKRESRKLEAGMVITIEPGVYIEGWGGIRIEDTVLVTATGCEVLTPTSKDLIEI